MTTYTVDESVGAVNICVNLTQPIRDIFENTVNVFVIDYSTSIHIPPGSPLASEFFYGYGYNFIVVFITF